LIYFQNQFNQTMKILIVVHTFLPKFLAGTEIYTYELTQALKKRNLEVRILYTNPLGQAYSLKKLVFNKIVCYEVQKDIRKVYHFKESYQDERVENFFLDVLADYKPDLIHYQHLMFLSTNMVRIALKRNICQVISVHDFWLQCLTHKRITTDNELCVNPTIKKCAKCQSHLINRYLSLESTSKPFLLTTIDKTKYKIKRSADYYFKRQELMKEITDRIDEFKDILRMVDAVTYPTKFLQKELFLWQLKGKRNIISTDGIQDEYFKNFKKIKSKKIRFGFIGSIVPAKGLIILVQAWEKLNNKKAILKIYGNFLDDPDYAKKITKIINQCNNIELMGTFDQDKIADAFKQLDVLIVPSTWYENAPLVIRDAFLAQIPVIGTDLGGISELIINNKNGLLFNNENVDDLYDKISYLIDHPKEITRMGKNCPKQKNMTENAEEMELLYWSLLKEKNKS